MARSHLSNEEQFAIRDAMAQALDAFEAKTGRRSAGAIAVATGINEHTAKAYLAGSRRPSVSFVRALADVAGIPASKLYIALGWLAASEMGSPDTHVLVENVASAAATLGRLEPQIRIALDRTSAVAPAVIAAATTILSDVEAASRFEVRLFQVVSGDTYRDTTNAAAEFTLLAGHRPLDGADLDSLARKVGMQWRPQPQWRASDPDYWSVHLELRLRSYAVLHDSDLGQYTWQGEPGTSTWTDRARSWPAHIIVQDPLGGVPQPGRPNGIPLATPQTIVVVGARYSGGAAAAALAQALGWQFVPVRSEVEVMSNGRFFPVARDRTLGRVLAWSSVARYIEQRYRDGEPWQAVVLLRPSAFRGSDELDVHALGLLRDTSATVVYPRPPHAFRSWWAQRQVGTSLPGQFNPEVWLKRTDEELQAVEHTLASRGGSDIYLDVPEPVEGCTPAGAAVPTPVMDAQARIAWTTMQWLDEYANRGRPSLRTHLFPGALTSWITQLATDGQARIPRLPNIGQSAPR